MEVLNCFDCTTNGVGVILPVVESIVLTGVHLQNIL